MSEVDPKVVRGVIGKAKLVLTPIQFRYFKLFYEHEMDNQQIADECGATIGSVYSALNKARKKMRREWQ